MKKQIILLFVMMMIGMMGLQAQNPIVISGTVRDDVNANPVPNQDVNIMLNDTSIFYSTVTTNQNGFYMDTIMPGGFVVNSIYIYTLDQCTFGIHDTLITNPGPVEYADFDICVDTTTGTNCQADFYYYPDSTNQYTFYFVDNSFGSGGVDSWFWDFGDGTTSTQQYPTHSYNSTGTFQVCLTITADSGTCTSVSCLDVVVTGGGLSCQADFSYSNSWDYLVSFTDQSTPQGLITSWSWTFGDGIGTSSQQNPTYTYAAPGYYNVCLTIESQDSGMVCTDTYCTYVLVDSIGGNCVADFYYITDSTQNNLVYFYDQSTPANTITSYYWDFGDGTTSSLQNPAHQYAGPGTYYTCLTIESQSGGMVCTDTYCMNVVVYGGGVVCEADFYYVQDTLGTSNNVVQFYDMSTPVGMIDSWYWNFGDGNTSTEQNPSHTYNAAGTYGVYLIITADSGFCTSTHWDTVFITIEEQYQLGGNVFAGIYQLDLGFAYAYESDNGNITNVFSEMIDTLGYYMFYPMVAADYYVKAEPSPNSSFFGQYMPTYYGDVVTWADASLISLSQNVYTADINLVPMSQATTGAGSIGGSMVHGGTLRSNTPAVGIQIMIKDENGNFVGLTYTDDEGLFEFTSLAVGVYTLMAEDAGKTMIPGDFILTEEEPAIDGISMIMTDDEIFFGPTGIETLGDITVSDVYPNPVNNILKMEVGLIKATQLSYHVVNQLGQSMFGEQIQLDRNQTLEINTSSLKSGMYFIEIISNDNHRITRRFVKL